MIGGFWDAIIGNNNPPSGASDEINGKFAQCEMKAKGLILKTINKVILLKLNSITETRESELGQRTTVIEDPSALFMWKYLKTTYEKKDGVASLLDFKLLFHANLIDNGTLGDQLNKLWELRARCAANELDLKDWVFAVLTLVALPASYSHIPDSLLASEDIKSLKPETVHAKIMETEICCNGKAGSSANTITLSTKPKDNKGKAPAPGTKCFHCRKEGHWANKCRQKKKKKPNAGPSDQKDSGSRLNVVESDAESDSQMFCYFGTPEDWLMDSGATDHMTPYCHESILGKLSLPIFAKKFITFCISQNQQEGMY